MDPLALEKGALAAVADASSTDDIERVRVEYLGRESELKLALREVRDRKTGMALNALRERLEEGHRAGLRATHTNSRLSLSKGLRSNQP